MNKRIFIIFIILFVTIIMLFNKKVSLIRLALRQLQVYKNAKTEKYSVWDFVSFILCPIIIAILIVCGLQYRIDKQLAEILTTVFSLVFTILFGFAAVIVERDEKSDSKKARVITETFVSIITSTVLSLIAAVLSMVILVIEKEIIVIILSIILFTLSFHIIMLLLMIMKRAFVIYCEEE